ncbi:EF-hand domain-containing protein [Halovulum sp. GXIMD14793]
MRKLSTIPAVLTVLMLGGAAWAAFSDVDADQDGYLSAEEFVAAFPNATEDTFQAADTNADGMISEAEHVAAVDAGLLPAAE